MADMTESRGHLSDKRRKADSVQCFCLFCSVFARGDQSVGKNNMVQHIPVS